MKRTTLIALCFITITASAQFMPSMRAGYNIVQKGISVTPGVNYQFNNIIIGGEMMVNARQEQPVNFGLKASYKYKFIEAGMGEWYMLYSLDPQNKNKNRGWVESLFTAIHYKQYFLQYEYWPKGIEELNVNPTGPVTTGNYKAEHRISLGVRVKF